MLTTCHCGAENFYRVTVAQRNGHPYRTEFVACAECRLMYHSPEPQEPRPPLDLLRVGTTPPKRAPPSEG